jgi:hypothetical protein
MEPGRRGRGGGGCAGHPLTQLLGHGRDLLALQRAGAVLVYACEQLGEPVRVVARQDGLHRHDRRPSMT